MPIYEYECQSCHHRIEVFASMSEPAPAACEACGAVDLKKVLFPASIHYRGSGFYSTDYGRKGGGSGSASSDSKNASSSEGGSSSSATSTASPSKD